MDKKTYLELFLKAFLTELRKLGKSDIVEKSDAVKESDEEQFLERNPDAKRDWRIDGFTTKAYATKEYFWLFNKKDGHFAWKYNREQQREIFACECIKGLRRTLAEIQDRPEEEVFEELAQLQLEDVYLQFYDD